MRRLTTLKNEEIKNFIENILGKNIEILERVNFSGTNIFNEEIDLGFLIEDFDLQCNITITTEDVILWNYFIDYLIMKNKIVNFPNEIIAKLEQIIK